MTIDWHGVFTALCLTFAATNSYLLWQHRRARLRLRLRYLARGRRLVQSMQLVRLAEELGELGHWQFDMRSEKQKWSAGLYALFGLDGPGELQPGDAEMLLAEGGQELARHIDANKQAHEAFAFDFGAMRVDGDQRTFRMQARNRFGKGGALLRIFGVVRDVTEQVRRENALLEAEQEAKRDAEEALRMAQTDALTGLANRRRVMDWLDAELASSTDSGTGIALIVFDLDHFKAVNDRYGHPAGDEVLRKVGEIARSLVRAEDLAGRMGGEEFVIGLKGADSRIASALAGRLCRAVAERSGTDAVPPVTTSIGYATLQPGDTSLGLFARADAALYAAKEHGRNQVRRAA